MLTSFPLVLDEGLLAKLHLDSESRIQILPAYLCTCSKTPAGDEDNDELCSLLAAFFMSISIFMGGTFAGSDLPKRIRNT